MLRRVKDSPGEGLSLPSKRKIALSLPLSNWAATKAFLTEEHKITYGQMKLDGLIAASWAQHWSTIEIENYTLGNFKEFLLNDIAPWANNMHDAMSDMLAYTGWNKSVTQIMEKAQEFSMTIGLEYEAFWANWIVAKAPPNVKYLSVQQIVAIWTLGEAKSHIVMIPRTS